MDLKFALATVKRDWPAECVDVRFTFERMDNSFQRSGAASGSTELLAAAEMLSSLLRERELAVHCIDEVFKAVADLPQHPADAYFSILRFRKETGRHKTLI